MDLTFKTDNGLFNYRVAAVIINHDKILTKPKILVMRDSEDSHYYLPGGRVNLHETAEHAIIREVKEELKIDAKITRPLWLNQGFFPLNNNEKCHEICIYFLIDVSETDLLQRGEEFDMREENRVHHFKWLSFEDLQKSYFYPLFLKKEIFNLPETFTINTEIESI